MSVCLDKMRDHTVATRSGGFAGVAQLAEHVLGKDEVTGSIPVSSFVGNSLIIHERRTTLPR